MKEVLIRFGLIHCQSCEIPSQTVDEAASSKNLPAEVLVNALASELE